MKRRFVLCLTLILLFSGVTVPKGAAVETSAACAILVDATSGDVLYEKNADQKMLIASTTKIMTALVALWYGELSDIVTVSRRAANTIGSSMYLKAGERLTLEALLYGLLLSSGNDAGVAIAEHVGGGSEAVFVQHMNETARALGMTNSSFANPHGLDDKNNYSTARDMAKLANVALGNPVFRRMVSTKTIKIGNRSLTNHNKLLGALEGCIGVKNGYTKAAGRTLVTCVERYGRRLIVVTIKDGNDYNDHRALYDYGFSIAPKRCICAGGSYLGEVPVSGAEKGYFPLMAGDELYFSVPEGEPVAMRLELYGDLYAPISVGTPVGVAVYSWNGVEIGRVPAVMAEEVREEIYGPEGVTIWSLYGPEGIPAGAAW